LQCLLLTQDHSLLDLVRPSLQSYGIEVEIRNEVQSAAEVSTRRHLDGFILDCDDVPGGTGLVHQVRKGRSNQHSTLFAIVNGKTSFPQALEMGANFVLSKPVRKEQLCSYLKIARVFMIREHRRYFRYTVDVPLTLQTPCQEIFPGRLVNVSEGGLALRMLKAGGISGTVRVCFDLPSITPHRIELKGEVVWADKEAQIGVRFHYVPDDARIDFLNWLSLLESQMVLRECNVPDTTMDPETGTN